MRARKHGMVSWPFLFLPLEVTQSFFFKCGFQERNLDWFPRMRAMSLVSSDSEGEQNELRNLQEKLESTMKLVTNLSGQLSELKDQVKKEHPSAYPLSPSSPTPTITTPNLMRKNQQCLCYNVEALHLDGKGSRARGQTHSLLQSPHPNPLHSPFPG